MSLRTSVTVPPTDGEDDIRNGVDLIQSWAYAGKGKQKHRPVLSHLNCNEKPLSTCIFVETRTQTNKSYHHLWTKLVPWLLLACCLHRILASSWVDGYMIHIDARVMIHIWYTLWVADEIHAMHKPNRGMLVLPKVSQMGYRYMVAPCQLWRFCATMCNLRKAKAKQD